MKKTHSLLCLKEKKKKLHLIFPSEQVYNIIRLCEFLTFLYIKMLHKERRMYKYPIVIY